MRKVSLFLLLIVAVGFGSAEAGLREKSWELGASLTHVDGDTSVDVDNGTGGTARVGYNVSEKLEAEALFSFSTADVGGVHADFDRAIVQIVGNFLNDRGFKHSPYISAGVGIINVTIETFTDSNDVRQPEAFDSAALLTLAVGSRYFFNENWAVRYEGRYFHHDAFEEGQDVYAVDVGFSWVLGGQQ